MSTHAIIAKAEGDGWRGRYVHFDGYPDGVGAAIRRIVERDGYETAVRVLIDEAPQGWSSLNHSVGENAERSGVAEVVPGYGLRYDDEPDVDDWYTYNTGVAEYVYVIGPDGAVLVEW